MQDDVVQYDLCPAGLREPPAVVNQEVAHDLAQGKVQRDHARLQCMNIVHTGGGTTCERYSHSDICNAHIELATRREQYSASGVQNVHNKTTHTCNTVFTHTGIQGDNTCVKHEQYSHTYPH